MPWHFSRHLHGVCAVDIKTARLPRQRTGSFPQTVLLHSGAHLVACERWDPRTRRLILRVEPSGRKSLYFEHARGTRVRLGASPKVNVDMARREIPNGFNACATTSPISRSPDTTSQTNSTPRFRFAA